MEEEKKYIYRCKNCNKTETVSEGAEAPTCCEKIMVLDPLTQCTIPDHPEMTRNQYEDEPCDDNTGKA